MAKKDKVLLKYKESIKATLQELNITTPVDGVNTVNTINNNINEDTKEIFSKVATDVMAAYVSSLQEKNAYCTFKFLPSPNKREIAKMKVKIFMEELEMKKALIQSKTQIITRISIQK
jgi:hypothetical protein